ncbi:MAG: hypothetical protein LBT40_10275, partial [Deltaproteobacteria bacterium]|nr:hypothetical protein [Deltaproteobacteria bacterium]
EGSQERSRTAVKARGQPGEVQDGSEGSRAAIGKSRTAVKARGQPGEVQDGCEGSRAAGEVQDGSEGSRAARRGPGRQ